MSSAIQNKYDDMPATVANRSNESANDALSESAKWRKQEEEWARAEEQRWANKGESTGALKGAILDTDEYTNTSRKGGLTETASNDEADSTSGSPLQNHPNVISYTANNYASPNVGGGKKGGRKNKNKNIQSNISNNNNSNYLNANNNNQQNERFNKLRSNYESAAGADISERQGNDVGDLKDSQKRPYLPAQEEERLLNQQKKGVNQQKFVDANSNEFIGSPKGISRVASNRPRNLASPLQKKDDNRAPYSTRDVTTTVAGTIRANHCYDDHIIVDHDSIMEEAGGKFNEVAEQVGITSRFAPGTDAAQPNYGSPTAYLDDEAIRDEKLHEQELKERIESKNQEMLNQAREGDERDSEVRRLRGTTQRIGVGKSSDDAVFRGRAFDDMYADEASIANRQARDYDPNAPSENYVAFHKPRGYNNAALSDLHNKKKGLFGNKEGKKSPRNLNGSMASMDGKEEKNPTFTRAASSLVKQQFRGERPTPADAIPLGAQGYEGLPPRSIPKITQDTPDAWFEQHRRETFERRSQKETQRRVHLEHDRVESGNSLGFRLKSFFKNSKAQGKSRMKEHDAHSEDRSIEAHRVRTQERINKYFPDRSAERIVCAFDAQGLHHYGAMDGHLILTAKTLMFIGKAVDIVEIESNEICYDKKAPKPHTKKEHLLVAEAIPLENILSLTRGAVVKNHGKVFILDIVDPLIHADAIQFFAKDGVNYQFRNFSHPCVKKNGESFDGKVVLPMDRFINFFDHSWRSIVGDSQQVEYREYM